MDRKTINGEPIMEFDALEGVVVAPAEQAQQNVVLLMSTTARCVRYGTHNIVDRHTAKKFHG